MLVYTQHRHHLLNSIQFAHRHIKTLGFNTFINFSFIRFLNWAHEAQTKEGVQLYYNDNKQTLIESSENIISRVFGWWGLFCMRNVLNVISNAFLIEILCVQFKDGREPQKVWISNFHQGPEYGVTKETTKLFYLKLWFFKDIHKELPSPERSVKIVVYIIWKGKGFKKSPFEKVRNLYRIRKLFSM